MKISELKAEMNADIEGEIISIEDERYVRSRFGKNLRVANARMKDDSGEINLSLWEDDIDRFKVGDKIKIESGWVSSFKDELRISVGRSGKITKME